MVVKTKCHICGKEIFIQVPVPKTATEYNTYSFSCNDCVPVDSAARNGIEESTYAELPLAYKLRKRKELRNKEHSNVMFNSKTITCSGKNIVIKDNKIIVDGKVLEDNLIGNIAVVVNGDVSCLECDGSVEVHGNSGAIDCGGSCTIDGNVSGDIDAGGSVTCGNVEGDIDAGGSVRCKSRK